MAEELGIFPTVANTRSSIDYLAAVEDWNMYLS